MLSLFQDLDPRSPRGSTHFVPGEISEKLYSDNKEHKYNDSEGKEREVEDDDDDEDGEGIESESNSSTNIDGNEYGRQFTSTVIVEQFLHKLFPGRSIFTKKRNVLEIISVHHDYFSMAGGSTLNQSRTIRFLLLVSSVLSSIFTDTIFFGIYFPGDSKCTSMITQVNKTIFSNF